MHIHNRFAVPLMAILFAAGTAFAVPPTVIVTYPNGGETLPVLNVVGISWTATPGDVAIASFEIWLSHDNTNWVSLGTTSPDSTQFTWTVPMDPDPTCWISVVATDINNVVGYDHSDGPFAIGPRTETHHVVDGWALLSLPLIPTDGAIGQVFGDNLQHRYVVYGFEPNRGFFNADTAYNGKGYFIGFDEFGPGATFDVTGYPVTSDSVTVQLTPAWNVITTPFRSASQLSAATYWVHGQAYSYNDALDQLYISPVGFTFDNNSYTSDDVLQPWHGYWFHVNVDSVTVTLYPTSPHPAPGRDEADAGTPSDWALDLQATYANFHDGARLGVLPNATAGFDNRYDYAEPPTPPAEDWVSLGYDSPEMHAPFGEWFDRDIRAPMDPGDTQSWTLVARTAHAGDVTLTWAEISQTTPDRNSYTLIDDDSQQQTDMRATGSYTFRCNGSKHLTVRVQSSLSVNAEHPSIPSYFAISSVRPNPFNSTTRIDYTLPNAGNVKLMVVDLSGREVQEIESGLREAGVHSVTLNADHLGAGSYFVRLEAGGRVATAKLFLVK